MEKGIPYEQDAVLYNEVMAEAAEQLTDRVEHPTIKKWVVGIGKQHRAHASRHQKKLDRLISEDGGVGTPEPVSDELSAEDIAVLEAHTSDFAEDSEVDA